jgi:hypothetical protein
MQYGSHNKKIRYLYWAAWISTSFRKSSLVKVDAKSSELGTKSSELDAKSSELGTKSSELGAKSSELGTKSSSINRLHLDLRKTELRDFMKINSGHNSHIRTINKNSYKACCVKI